MTTPWGVPALLEDAQVVAFRTAMEDCVARIRGDSSYPASPDFAGFAEVVAGALLRALGTGEEETRDRVAVRLAFYWMMSDTGPAAARRLAEEELTNLTAPLRARIALLEADLFAETQGRELLADCEARLATAEARVTELETKGRDVVAYAEGCGPDKIKVACPCPVCDFAAVLLKEAP